MKIRIEIGFADDLSSENWSDEKQKLRDLIVDEALHSAINQLLELGFSQGEINSSYANFLHMKGLEKSAEMIEIASDYL